MSLALSSLSFAGSAFAQMADEAASPDAATAEPVAAETPAPPPPPYSLPWQLRPVVPGTVIRSDTAFAFYEAPNDGDSGTTVATTLLGSYKVTPEFAPLVRLGLVTNSPPEIPGAMVQAESGTAFMNPVLGGTYGIKLSPELRLAFALCLAIPIGSGGGNDPDPGKRTAMVPAGILARSAMDNAMFAMNYLTPFGGVGFAYIAGGFTAQVEVTVLELIRVRGDDVDQDEARTNFTSGLHLGYFIIPQLSISGEIRHQRWLSTPATVEANPPTRDTTTFAIGPRLHFKLSDTMWIRPGIAYARALDKPMTDGNYDIVQLDVPLVF